ncbi:MAG: FecR domain-containing protein [Tannerella sp.]|jgi:ferric-dicitrate binding protein FerR (iron transport regulator)|nr:FecR domain-containing protein [Tannerella sp.]
MKENKNKIDTLCDELVNDLTAHDNAILEEWSNSKEDNRKFRRLINGLKLSDNVEQTAKEMKPTILMQINKRIDKEKQFRRLLRISTIAASLLILLSITSYFSYEQGFKKINNQQIEMHNPLGMRSTITLPDGSKAVLNAGTTISYPNAFVSKNREVSIEGEAYFEVVHDISHPFIVKTDYVNVEVMGTQFNVKAYEDDERVEVSLSEGKVGVRIANQKEISMLTPGQQAYYDKQTRRLITRNVNLAYYTSWKDGKYYFNKLPLKEITNQLERIFNVRIYITSQELQNMELTGDFVRNENLEQILHIIEKTANNQLNYQIDEDAIYINERQR